MSEFGWGATLEQVELLGAVTPASEVKKRPGKGGSGDLSYVDARFVQDRFDDTVGCMNWARRHFVDANGNVGCEVGVLIDYSSSPEPQWVWKSDIGTESTIESIKGQYSDSFKRASVNWGVARDLYDEKSEARAARPAPPTGRAVYSDPDPDPEWLCPVHGTRKVVPSGHSQRTGKDYPAFAACAERECNEKPPRKPRGQGRVAKPAGVEFVGMAEE